MIPTYIINITSFLRDDNINNILIMRYENGNHFSFLKIKISENKANTNNNVNNNIINKNVSLNEVKQKLKTNQFIKIVNKSEYYNNIYN